jgi:hypothetical protein
METRDFDIEVVANLIGMRAALFEQSLKTVFFIRYYHPIDTFFLMDTDPNFKSQINPEDSRLGVTYGDYQTMNTDFSCRKTLTYYRRILPCPEQLKDHWEKYHAERLLVFRKAHGSDWGSAL